MLMGMSFLFGVTGEMQLDKIIAQLQNHASSHLASSPLLLLGVVLVLISFLFKLAAAPLHFYAGDVYQGAATPVTAAISFIPKVTGVVAIIKLLDVAGVGTWTFDPRLIKLVWIVALLTMTVGNILGLLQYNVKRVLAYSSIAHSGYILVGLVTAMTVAEHGVRAAALAGVSFYLLAYGLMNAAAFGVLMLLPSKSNQPATTAETYDDLAGAGRKNPDLGLAMAIACFSLIGIPATAGFFGKLYLVKPAIQSGDSSLVWLAIFTMVNAAISAGYYLKIVAMMWSKAAAPVDDQAAAAASQPRDRAIPVQAAVAIAVAGVVAIGVLFPLAGEIYREATRVVQTLAS
jgi:NADH-quinone oxidoreductase subunit N